MHCIEVLMKLTLKRKNLSPQNSGKSPETLIKSSHTSLWEGQIIPLYHVLFLNQFNKFIPKGWVGGRATPQKLFSSDAHCPEGKIHGLESRGGTQSWL